MDIMVLETQKWINETYGKNPGFGAVDEDGYTGWETINGLIRALQIELGITSLANNFGPTTVSRFKTRFPNGILEQNSGAVEEDNIYGIIQGALWCKGYSTGAFSITTHFYGGTGNAIKSLKSHMGIDSTSSAVTLNVMKALLSMDQFKLVSKGSMLIRTIQQTLNARYESYIGIIPCDGIYGRSMNKAFIFVLQAVEGQSVAEADGSFGPGTQARLPILPDTQGKLSTLQVIDASNLVKYALVCNGFTTVDLSVSGWNDSLAQVVGQFQASMVLPITKKADKDTWMSLLLSKGNPNRAAKACDTRFEMTAARISTLKSNGYEIVGRYINGTEFKVLRDEEPARIINMGLSFFPIYQDSGTNISYFTAARGRLDALAASHALRKFHIPEENIVFFAVDMDPLDMQIQSHIIPYFEALNEEFDCSYKIGIYGTRNVCSQVCAKGLAVTSFVSDMSTGFSGNMGFKMPPNWTYDQFSETSMGSDWAIDKDAYSGKYPPVNRLNLYRYTQPEKPVITSDTPSITSIINAVETLENIFIEYVSEQYNQLSVVVGVTNFLRSFNYADLQWLITTMNPIDNEFIKFIKSKYETFYNSLIPHLSGQSATLFTDGIGGQIELPHLAATLECYAVLQPIPDFWAGWGGDLASGMNHTNQFLNSEAGQGFSIQAAADKIIGIEVGLCNYSDLCMDADAIKLAQMVNEAESTDGHALSTAMSSYYAGLCENRYSYYLSDIGSNSALGNLKSKIHAKMNGVLEVAGLLHLKAGGASAEINKACCDAFAQYLHKELTQ